MDIYFFTYLLSLFIICPANNAVDITSKDIEDNKQMKYNQLKETANFYKTELELKNNIHVTQKSNSVDDVDMKVLK